MSELQDFDYIEITQIDDISNVELKAIKKYVKKYYTFDDFHEAMKSIMQYKWDRFAEGKKTNHYYEVYFTVASKQNPNFYSGRVSVTKTEYLEKWKDLRDRMFEFINVERRQYRDWGLIQDTYEQLDEEVAIIKSWYGLP